jgi:spore germination protein GerM
LGDAKAAAEASDTTTVYFLTAGGSAPAGVRRAIAPRSGRALRALEQLLAGPTDEIVRGELLGIQSTTR